MKISLTGIFGFCLLGSCSLQNDNPTNVLFIAIDDLRPELNSFGADHIISPNIDKLASEGVKFTRAYCNIPVCGASRASIMTGLRPTRERFLTYFTRADEDAPGITTLPEYFRQNNYYTISNGKVFHHADDAVRSWDEIWNAEARGSWRDYLIEENIKLDLGGETRGPATERVDVPDNAYKDGKTADKTIEDLKRLKEMDKPFFLAAGFLKPHLPFNAPEKYWTMYEPEDIVFPTNDYKPENAPDMAIHNSGELRAYSGVPDEGPVTDEFARNLIHGYYACVSYTDAQVGRVLDALEELELAENTLVVLWGDHGWNLREHGMWCKHCNFETSLHVPLIIKSPAIKGGSSVRSITEFVDIYPTICDLAGLEKLPHLEGESLEFRMLNPEQEIEDYAVSKWYNGATLIEKDYFYTEWSSSENPFLARMLYDHSNDPGETVSISEMQENESIVSDLSGKLKDRWGKDYDKPIEGR